MFITFVVSKPTITMKENISKERRRIEKELLFYLRRYRFYASRFKRLNYLDSIINEIVNELKRDF